MPRWYAASIHSLLDRLSMMLPTEMSQASKAPLVAQNNAVLQRMMLKRRHKLHHSVAGTSEFPGHIRTTTFHAVRHRVL